MLELQGWVLSLNTGNRFIPNALPLPLKPLFNSADEVFKGSAFMTEVLADPVMGHSESPAHTPMSVGNISIS